MTSELRPSSGKAVPINQAWQPQNQTTQTPNQTDSWS